MASRKCGYVLKTNLSFSFYFFGGGVCLFFLFLFVLLRKTLNLAQKLCILLSYFWTKTREKTYFYSRGVAKCMFLYKGFVRPMYIYRVVRDGPLWTQLKVTKAKVTGLDKRHS